MQTERDYQNELFSTVSYSAQAFSLDALGELGRATTAYHEALPDRIEYARQEYEEALRRFNASCK